MFSIFLKIARKEKQKKGRRRQEGQTKLQRMIIWVLIYPKMLLKKKKFYREIRECVYWMGS